MRNGRVQQNAYAIRPFKETENVCLAGVKLNLQNLPGMCKAWGSIPRVKRKDEEGGGGGGCVCR